MQPSSSGYATPLPPPQHQPHNTPSSALPPSILSVPMATQQPYHPMDSVVSNNYPPGPYHPPVPVTQQWSTPTRGQQHLDVSNNVGATPTNTPTGPHEYFPGGQQAPSEPPPPMSPLPVLNVSGNGGNKVATHYDL
eukprot:TRINITY_DN86088_c0_g1_i1.p1 TRINITY_DN86088_c0_g1~~TRINITY_DN86088_c0_g1_i1.p1  ORF type:complete len:136 (+),score=33.08 TRINITY_DN86088_c0_g1_i1:1-408(+)